MRFPVLGHVSLFAVIAWASPAAAHEGHAPIPAPKVKFDHHSRAGTFEQFRGTRIIMPASLNGHATPALIDSGTSMTTLDRRFARAIGLPIGAKISAQGVGGSVDAEMLSGVTLEVAGMRFENMTVGVMDLAGISRGIGRPIDLIVGREFFNSALVSIDWAASTLTARSAAAFTPAEGATSLTLTRMGPFATLPVSVAGAPAIQALLDLGNGGAITLPRTYWGSKPEIAGLHFAESRIGGPAGLRPVRSVTLPSVTLAGQSFAAVPASLAEGGNDRDPTQMPNVGVGLLKQFRVDLDLGHDRLYLTPRADAPGFARDRLGAGMDLQGDRLKVIFVSPQGPAARAGLKEGDEIIAVDGRKVTADYYRGSDWTRAAAGKSVVLDRADGSRATVTLQDYY